ncbi:S1C family serine protease [Hymenobacter daeguensis]
MTRTATNLVSGALLSALLLQSCATIISSPKQSLRVVGQPDGSTFYVNDKEIKAKPVAGKPGTVTLRLPRSKNTEVKVKHEGYKEYSEVVYPDGQNPATYLNYIPVAGTLYGLAKGIQVVDGESNVSPVTTYGWAAGLSGLGIDYLTGSLYRLNKTELKPSMVRVPKAVAGSQTVQCALINVRLKGGDKMGNVSVAKETQEILYFGKSLDVDAEHLKADVNASLKDLGFSVPTAEGRSVFSTGSSSRYTLQGEMHDVKYDILANSKYEAVARYETHCTVEVTWKLVNQNRKTVFEQKTSGTSVKFENGGSAAFEDAFENALFAFMGNSEVTTALAKPADGAAATAADDNKLESIVMHRGTAARPAADNGVSTAAKSVVIVETSDGHGSGCIISGDGYIVTNAHVVGEEETVKVLLADGLELKGKVVRVNPDMDLALVKIESDGLTAFQLPSTSTAEIGADVFAIGTPADKELGQSISKGIISGRRRIDGHALLQTDVSINGGNSGGALVGRSGQLLGIVNAKLVGRGIEGIGFAIPAEQVSEALQLKFID